MLDKEAIELIKILKKENENNSQEDKVFNNEWIRLVKKSWEATLDKKYLVKLKEWKQQNNLI
jgi:hypothetical protein